MKAHVIARNKGRVKVLPFDGVEMTDQDKIGLARQLRQIAGVKRAYIRHDFFFLRINTGIKGVLRQIKKTVGQFVTDAMKAARTRQARLEKSASKRSPQIARRRVSPQLPVTA